jgi:hypothetical protein
MLIDLVNRNTLASGASLRCVWRVGGLGTQWRCWADGCLILLN